MMIEVGGPNIFDTLKDEWWDPKGKLKSLHKITPLRFEYYLGVCNDHFEASSKGLEGVKGKRVLDLGCGGGLLSERFSEAGALVTGIDLSTVAIEAARAHAEAGGLDIDYRNLSVEELLKGEGSESFDVVLCSEVLEHVEDLEGFVRSSSALIKKGGLYLFSTINSTLKAKLLIVTMAEDVLGMLPKGTHDPSRFIKPSALAAFMRMSGVDVKEFKGMRINPIGFTCKLSEDLSVNYLGYGVKS